MHMSTNVREIKYAAATATFHKALVNLVKILVK